MVGRPMIDDRSDPELSPGWAAGGLLLAAALALLSISALEAPEPLGPDAPAELFSAARAMRHVERLAAVPRPLGSEAHERARAYVLGELAALGFETEVQESVAVRELRPGTWLAVRVQNVVGRRRGASPAASLLLVAHYDSRPQTPGAGDDASGVATLLESLRALGSGPAPANDLIVLLSDGEELGLMGARAFAAEHPWFEEVSLVLNFEGRGNRGPVLMFETGPGSGRLVREFLRTAPRPFASSLSAAIYRRMPNDTDLSIFRDAGLPGLNFSFIAGLPTYHSWLDTPERLSRATLQHHGDNAVALLPRLGDLELSEAFGEESVYFNTFGAGYAIYPLAAAAPLSLLALVLAAGAVFLALRRGGASIRGVMRGLLTSLGLVAGSILAGTLFWQLLKLVPGLLRTPHGIPYEGGALAVALILAVTAGSAAILSRLAKRVASLELAAGALLCWALPSVCLSLLEPAAGHLLAWPALPLAVGLAAAALAGGRRARAILLGAAALPAVLLAAPTAGLVLEALTLRLAVAPMLLVGLLLAALSPLLAAVNRAGRGWPARVAGVAALALLAWVLAGARATPARPRADTLIYVLDHDAGEARWLSLDPGVDVWTVRALGPEAAPGPAPEWLGWREEQVLSATAPSVQLPAPEARIEDAVDGTFRLRPFSPRQAPVLSARIRAASPLRSVSVDGKPLLSESGEAELGSELELIYFGAPTEGIELTVETERPGALELELIDRSLGLPGPVSPGVRPPQLIASTSWRTDTTWVRRSLVLEPTGEAAEAAATASDGGP